MIKLSISLSDQGKTALARQEITDYLTQFGMEQTGSGMVTLSFVATEDTFAKALGGADTANPGPSTRPDRTVGASGPYDEPAITIPRQLEPLIDHISVSPPARHFGDNKR